MACDSATENQKGRQQRRLPAASHLVLLAAAAGARFVPSRGLSSDKQIAAIPHIPDCRSLFMLPAQLSTVQVFATTTG